MKPLGPPILTPRQAWLVLGVALVYPTLTSWLYFVALPGRGSSSAELQTAYAVSKLVQFTFPLLCLWLWGRGFDRPKAPTIRGLAAGAGFGLLVLAGMLLLYFVWLRPTSFMAETSLRLRKELADFGLASPVGFALFA